MDMMDLFCGNVFVNLWNYMRDWAGEYDLTH